MNEFRADLHCHSTFSDGTDTPEELIGLALKQGLLGLSITDHDTIDAYQGETLAQAQKNNLLLLPGVELSATYRGDPVHVLGYGYSLKSPELHDFCKRHYLRRWNRLKAILKNLKKLGIVIEEEELLKGPRSIGRPHLANILIERGVVRSVKEAFDKFLGEGKAAYSAGEPISVEETIEVIHKAKGKAILAHPHLIKKTTTIRAVLNMPLDGIEAYYARLAPAQEKEWVEKGTKKGWIITGGSDYHGATKPNNILGSSWVGKETFEGLYAHYLAVASAS